MSPDERYTVSSRVALHTIVGNVVLSIGKGVIGFTSGSTALVADAMHSLSDVISTVVVMFGMKIASTPPDSNHPYGHGRAESIAAKILALLLIGAGLGMVATAVTKILHGTTVIPGALAIWAAVVSIVAKEAMYWYAVVTGRRYNNRALIADAWHHRSDALSSVAALIGVLLARAGHPLIDPISGIVVAVLIIGTAVGILRESIDELMDTQSDKKLIGRLSDLCKGVEGIHQIDTLRIRKYGADVVVDLGITVPGDLTVLQGHDVAHAVKSRLVNEVADVVDVLVHVNPARNPENSDANGFEAQHLQETTL